MSKSELYKISTFTPRKYIYSKLTFSDKSQLFMNGDYYSMKLSQLVPSLWLIKTWWFNTDALTCHGCCFL